MEPQHLQVRRDHRGRHCLKTLQQQQIRAACRSIRSELPAGSQEATAARAPLKVCWPHPPVQLQACSQQVLALPLQPLLC